MEAQVLKQLLYSVAAALLIGFGSTGTASATPILSGDGTETCTPNGGATGACVGIGVDPA